MTKRLFSLLLSLLLCASMLTACTTPQGTSTEESTDSEESSMEELKIPEEIPVLRLYSGEKEMTYVSAPTVWNGAMFKRSNILRNEELFQDVRLLTPGSTIVFSFLKFPSEDFIVTESQLWLTVSENDGFEYTESVSKQIEVVEQNGEYFISMPPPPTEREENRVTQMAPPDMSPYLYGYTVTVKWGENICDYAFVVEPVSPISPEESTVESSTAPVVTPEPSASQKPATTPQASQPSGTGTSASSAPTVSPASGSATDLVRNRFRAIGLTFYEDGSEADWIDKVVTDYQLNGYTLNSETMQYISFVHERSFIINYPSANMTSTAPPSQPSASSASGSNNAFDINTVEANAWAYAESLGFYRDTSLTIENNSWFNPTQTKHSTNVEQDVKDNINAEARVRGVGELNIIIVSDGNGGYTIYVVG